MVYGRDIFSEWVYKPTYTGSESVAWCWFHGATHRWVKIEGNESPFLGDDPGISFAVSRGKCRVFWRSCASCLSQRDLVPGGLEVLDIF